MSNNLKLIEVNYLQRYCAVILILFALALAYFPLWSNGFIVFDDGIYITSNEHVRLGLTLENVRWAFSFEDKPATYWHPATWLSLMLDHDLFALNPAGYHGMNLLLHSANALLIFIILHLITRSMPVSSMITAIFLLHPVNVETVAWAVERKTLLCTFFGLLSVLTYIKYVIHPSIARYLAVFILLAFGLMAKPMIVTLPCAFLLLDYWPFSRFRAFSPSNKHTPQAPQYSIFVLALEKVPLFLLSATSYFLTVLSQRGRVIEPPFPIFSVRLENAVISYVIYLKTLLWPSGLAIYYPPRMTHYPTWQTIAAAAVLLGIIYYSIRTIRTRPWWFVGFFWYAGTLITTSGLVRSGLWPERADRFIYLPSFGLLLILACEVCLLDYHLKKIGRAWQIMLMTLISLYLITLAVVTNMQVRVWKDEPTLFEHAVRVTANNTHAHHILGKYYFSSGDQIKAFNHFAAERSIDPLNPDYDIYLGYLSYLNRNYDFAMEKLERVLDSNPDNLDALYLMGKICEDQGNPRQAREYYSKGLASRALDLYSMRPLFKERLNALNGSINE